MAMRAQIAGGNLDELARGAKETLGFEVELAANERTKMWPVR